jgi:hypothetical protein
LAEFLGIRIDYSAPPTTNIPIYEMMDVFEYKINDVRAFYSTLDPGLGYSDLIKAVSAKFKNLKLTPVHWLRAFIAYCFVSNPVLTDILSTPDRPQLVKQLMDGVYEQLRTSARLGNTLHLRQEKVWTHPTYVALVNAKSLEIDLEKTTPTPILKMKVAHWTMYFVPLSMPCKRLAFRVTFDFKFFLKVHPQFKGHPIKTYQAYSFDFPLNRRLAVEIWEPRIHLHGHQCQVDTFTEYEAGDKKVWVIGEPTRLLKFLNTKRFQPGFPKGLPGFPMALSTDLKNPLRPLSSVEFDIFIPKIEEEETCEICNANKISRQVAYCTHKYCELCAYKIHMEFRNPKCSHCKTPIRYGAVGHLADAIAKRRPVHGPREKGYYRQGIEATAIHRVGGVLFYLESKEAIYRELCTVFDPVLLRPDWCSALILRVCNLMEWLKNILGEAVMLYSSDQIDNYLEGTLDEVMSTYPWNIEEQSDISEDEDLLVLRAVEHEIHEPYPVGREATAEEIDAQFAAIDAGAPEEEVTYEMARLRGFLMDGAAARSVNAGVEVNEEVTEEDSEWDLDSL